MFSSFLVKCLCQGVTKGHCGIRPVPSTLALALCLQIMTRPSCTTVTEVATTTTTTKVNMGLISMMTVFLVLSIVLCQEVTKRHCETWPVPSTLALALCTNNDTPQLHDRDGGSDDDDDESGYGADRYDDDILYHMKDGGVVQIELCRRQIVHSDVGLRMNRWLHFHLWWFKQIIVRALTKRNERF